MSTETISVEEEQSISDITKEHVLVTTGPVTVGGGTPFTVYLDNEISRPSKYRNLVEFLDKAKPEDVFTLKLNGPGGYLDTCTQLIHAIQSTEATVVGELVGEICSAHANIFVACHTHIIHPYSVMMVHTITGGAYGKGEDIIRMGNAANEVIKLMYADLFDGFLTEQELTDVLDNNKDLWFVGGDDIEARLENLHVLRDAAVEELQAKGLREAQDDLLTASDAIRAERATELTITDPNIGLSDVTIGTVDLATLPNVEED